MKTYTFYLLPDIPGSNAINFLGSVEENHNIDGELGKPALKKLPLRRKKATFRSNVKRYARQSENVEDRRTDSSVPEGMYEVAVKGYLRWNTFFHLSSSVPFHIRQSLSKQGFNVRGVSTIEPVCNLFIKQFSVISSGLHKF